jgi:hypothetical protein
MHSAKRAVTLFWRPPLPVISVCNFITWHPAPYTLVQPQARRTRARIFLLPINKGNTNPTLGSSREILARREIRIFIFSTFRNLKFSKCFSGIL